MATVTWTLPELGENVEKATVLQVMVRAGDTVSLEQPVIEVETDKVTVEVPCTMSGTVTAVHVKAGESVKTGQTVLTIEGSEPQKDVSPKKVVSEKVATPAKSVITTETALHQRGNDTAAKSAGRSAPLARRLARELGVTIDEIAGSGPHGEVFLDDVKEYVHGLVAHARGARRSTLPDFSKWGETHREPMSQIRSTTAERMTLAWTTIPHVTHFDEADITALEVQRKQWNEQLKKGDAKLTVTAILLHIVAKALKQFPQFNASIDVEKQEIVYKEYCNIGVAVDTEQGLLVPVVKSVDTKKLAALSKELGALAEKARARKLTMDDIQGASFTISNLGGIGGTNFTPIVNPPEVAILAVSRGTLIDGKQLLPLGLSYDHRLIDGAAAARFVRSVVEGLETTRISK